MTRAIQAAACGLDFGTSNSTVGVAQHGSVRLLALEGDKTTLPSVVFFHADDGHVSFGRAALSDYLGGHEGRLMRSLKSLLGTAMMDDVTEVAGRAVPFRELLATFIGEAKRRAEQSAGERFDRVVLGRPVFFVDDDAAADQRAENTLRTIAEQVGFKDVGFQYEPIAAAFDYESTLTREELVLVVDIGGGTSDFTLIGLSPERALAARQRTDRKADILASGGVHIGGTDFDRTLSLASVMPTLGLGSLLTSGLQMPSSHFFNLATWHTINLAYTRRAAAQIESLTREATEKSKLARLQTLVDERSGHWLAMQVETAKMALSDAPTADIDLDRLAAGEHLTLHRREFDAAIDSLVDKVEATIAQLLRDAGTPASRVDTVFFTGGSSGVPILRARVAAAFGGARLVEGDRFGSIGAGLALDAQRRFA